MLVSTSEGVATRFSWLPLILFILFQVLSQFPLIRWTFLTDQLKVVNSPMEALDLLKAGDYSSLDVEAFRCPLNQAGQDLVLADKYIIIIFAIIINTFRCFVNHAAKDVGNDKGASRENVEEEEEEGEQDQGLAEEGEEEEEYDDVCQSSSAVQRQLETIRQQKSDLIRQIMVNEEVGRGLADRLEAVTTIKEQEKYSVFLTELEKVVLLVFSVSGRLRKAEEEAEQGNLTDWEKESRRFRRDKLASQLKEAQELRRMSDRRMANVEAVIKRSLEAPESELELFRSYISKKEELVTAQRACEDLEKNILN